MRWLREAGLASQTVKAAEQRTVQLQPQQGLRQATGVPVRSGATRMRRELRQCADALRLISLLILVTPTPSSCCFAPCTGFDSVGARARTGLRLHPPLTTRPTPPAGAQKPRRVPDGVWFLRCCDLRGGDVLALGLGGGDCALERSPGDAELASGGRLWHAREDGVHGLLTRLLVGD